MTLLDSSWSGKPHGTDSGVLISSDGVRSSVVEDIGVGRGPGWLDDWLAANAANVVAWYRHIHTYPELPRQEFDTTELVAGLLRSVGLRPTLMAEGTGLFCDIGSGDRTVALRADLDALALTETTGLPYSSAVAGACHACGHDAHTAMLVAAGMALASAPQLPGRVRLIFQPAEEVMPGGALDVIAAGGIDGVDAIFGLHCDPRLEVGRVGTRVGAITSATDRLELTLTSPGGHTSRPHLTADLVHALGNVITGLPALLSRRVDPRSGTVLMWGAVHAGEAANAVPQDGVLRGTLRTGDHEVWEELEPLVATLVESLLAPIGVGFELHHQRGMPPVMNDAGCTQLMRAGIEAALGGNASTGTKQSSGGEDFGWYLEQIPGSFARLGVWDGDGPQFDLHRPTFRLDERALFVGVRVLTHTALAALASGS
ncbi:amidohydrolase [Actinophytocola sp.]|uniref:amidohydrolase n=1 Tax=Actinophytocola sp. TaxID=1872138 RepID=UPI003899C6B2